MLIQAKKHVKIIVTVGTTSVDQSNIFFNFTEVPIHRQRLNCQNETCGLR